MAAKLIALSLFAAALGLGLLHLRLERVQLAREVAGLDQQTRAARTELWAQQGHVAALTAPRALAERLIAARLAVEPAAPSAVPVPRDQLARFDDHPRTASP